MPASFYILQADTSVLSIPVGRLIISVCVYIILLPLLPCNSCAPSLSCSLLFPTLSSFMFVFLPFLSHHRFTTTSSFSLLLRIQ
ncbi:hypothetical protein CCUS01_15953 [Colletotrichum cuscutae]|uniref:Uncharacterized protein n=1 Tax=Colletotrichum cuscutae TaxID=1209917 RepID=A0AAI9VD46_9PEZI|nr:hypothetical protein CCUS01_15953 [Colletotrichum cuscutae]